MLLIWCYLYPRQLVFRHSWRYVAHMLDLMTLYTTQRIQYVCSSGRSNHRVGTQQESGSEMRNLALSRSFVTRTCRDDKDIKKQFRRQNAIGNAVGKSGSSYLHLLRQKSNCSNHIITPFIDVLFGVIHSRILLESLLSVMVTHSSVILASPDTPARVWHLR